MRSDIEIQSEGVTCRGWLYVPERRDPTTHETPCFADPAGAAADWFTTHLGR